MEQETGGRPVGEARRLKQLEEENRKLKQLVADLSLDKSMLQDALRGKPWRPSLGVNWWAGREWLTGSARPRKAGVSGVGGGAIPGAAVRYASVKPSQDALRRRLRELAEARPSFGYLRLNVLLRREGWTVNHKRVYRLYREEGLTMRTNMFKHPRLIR